MPDPASQIKLDKDALLGSTTMALSGFSEMGIRCGVFKQELLVEYRGSEGEDAGGLPEGWVTQTAPDGRQYYYHAASKTTSWEPPIAPGEPPIAPVVPTPSTTDAMDWMGTSRERWRVRRRGSREVHLHIA